MSEFMSYDPWAEITTRNGYAGDEMVAMLQKAIRRGKEEDALHAAYEMYITSPQFEKKLWRRLLCISVEEDVYKRQPSRCFKQEQFLTLWRPDGA